MEEPSRDEQLPIRPGGLRSLASKFSLFAGILVFWVVATILAYDLREDTFDVREGALVFVIVALVAAAIARFTSRILARPLERLGCAIRAVHDGRLETVEVPRTGDEIEFLAESFNAMIRSLQASHKQVREQQELLQQQIQSRTLQLERAMQSAETSSEAKSSFLAAVSGELRSPAASMIGMLDAALDQRLAPQQAQPVETAQRCARSLLALLNQIVDLSQIEARQARLEHVPFELPAVLKESLKPHIAEAAEQGIHLSCEFATPIPALLCGDAVRLRQAVSNLVRYAIHIARAPDVRMRISAVPAEGERHWIHMAFEKTGGDLAADQPVSGKAVQTIAGAAEAESAAGLAIGKRLVELQGGNVELDSPGGDCAIVTARIPFEVAAVESATGPARSSPAVEPAPVSGPARILIVEDNQVNQKVVTAVLRKRGFAIELANDGQEALHKLENSGHYDLVLMDVQMPVLDGLEATRLIRKNPRWNGLPIVAMTAHAMTGDKERCLDAGMNGYISKPVHPSYLLNVVDEYLLKTA